MSPPKVLDPMAGPSPFATPASELGRSRELAALAGIVNATYGAMVDVTVAVLAEGDHVGPGLHSPAQYLAWRLGCSKATASQLVRIAKRVDELPVLLSALRAGEISLDQADVVARYVPATYDRSATQLARTSTVEQLKTVLPAYRYRDETAEQAAARQRATQARRERSGGLFHDDDGGARLSVHLDPAQAAAMEAAIAAARDDEYRRRRDDAAAAAAETGGDPAKVEAPTMAEAAASVAASALAAGAAAHPGSDRYLITYHLGAGPDGRPCLTDEHGRVVPSGERRRLLCDHRFEAVVHGADGTPLSVGRATRHIGRKLRRAVLHRHRGRCAVPGCSARLGLELHHIEHWEDGGPTDTSNLLPLCRKHHQAHHDDLLLIEGDADRPPGTPGAVAFRTPDGRALEPVGQATPVRVDGSTAAALAPEAEARTGRAAIYASTPDGQRIHHATFHLTPDEPGGPSG